MTIREVSKKFGIPAETLRYYERVGVIPPVSRTAGGIRDFRESDIGWVENAKCMRCAGLTIGALIEYLKLYQKGDETIPERLRLLSGQLEMLQNQKQQLDETIERLNYKISRYQNAVETGVLTWDASEDCK